MSDSAAKTEEAATTDTAVNNGGEGSNPSTDKAEASRDTAANGTSDQGTKAETDASKAKEGEVKAEGQDKADDKAEGDKAKAGAPDKYEDFKLPENFEINEELAAKLHELGKEFNLPQEGAQRLVDLHLSVIDEINARQQDQWKQVKDDWKKQALADKDLHDEKGSAEPAVALALKAVDALGGEGLREALDLTGAGSHPLVVKAFYQIGKAMAEDKFVTGAVTSDNRSKAEKLYPSMKQKA